MRNKTVAIIIGLGLLAVAFYYFIVKKKSTTAASEAVEKALANLGVGGEAALQSLDTTKVAPIDATLTGEAKVLAEQQAAAEQALRDKLNALKIQYLNLFGVPAPAGSTEMFLENAVKEQSEINKFIQIYKEQSGDTDLSDNDFTTLVKVQQAIKDNEILQQQKAAADAAAEAARINAENQRLAGLAAAWSQRMTVIAGYVQQFIANFKDDGTSLNRKGFSSGVASQLNSLSDRDLVYAERFFNSQGVRNHTSYGGSYTGIASIQAALNTGISKDRGGTSWYQVLRGRLASLNGRYNITVNNINQYGDLTS